MSWDPRKTAGTMCNVHDCTTTRRLHGIRRRCGNGHRWVFRYCDEHISPMMTMALVAPGWLDDGSYAGTLLCRECDSPLELVLEGLVPSGPLTP